MFYIDWVGCDISRDMLNEAIADNGGVGSTETTGDYVKSDMGMGLPFRPGTFDGVISVSAIQVLYTCVYVSIDDYICNIVVVYMHHSGCVILTAVTKTLMCA